MTINSTYESGDSALRSICEHSEFNNRRHTFTSLKLPAGFPSVSPEQGPGDQNPDLVEFTASSLHGRHTAVCIKARCVTTSCPFRVTINRDVTGIWTVRQLDAHSCEVPTLGRRGGTTACQAVMLADVIAPRIISGLSLKRIKIRQELSPYLQKNPSGTFVSRVIESAISRCPGSPTENVARLPAYVRELNNLVHKAKIVTIYADEMVEIGMRVAASIHRRNVRNAAARRQSSSQPTQPGSPNISIPITAVTSESTQFNEYEFRSRLQQTAQANKRYLYAVMYGSQVSMMMQTKLFRVYSTYSAHCTGPTKGTMFTMYGSDSNHKQILMGIRLVLDNESERTWCLFLEFIRDCHPGLANDEIRIISDQEKGAKNAMSRILPEIKQFCCTSHRESNVYQNSCQVSGKLFRQALHCWTDAGLSAIKARLPERGANYIGVVAEEEQYPFKRQELFGRSTSQGVESMNNANTAVRKADVGRALILAVESDKARHSKALYNLSRTGASNPPPKRVEKLDKFRAAGHAFSFMTSVQNRGLERMVGRVPSAARPIFSYVVNLMERSCSCGMWQGTRFPCLHAAIFCKKVGRDLSSFVCDFDTRSKWVEQCENVQVYHARRALNTISAITFCYHLLLCRVGDVLAPVDIVVHWNLHRFASHVVEPVVIVTTIVERVSIQPARLLPSKNTSR